MYFSTEQTANEEERMSLELKLSNCNRSIKKDPLTKGSKLTVVEEEYWIEEEDDELLGSRQGFVCFSWKSPFQRYIDTCHLVSKLLISA